ncbi:MAG: hypothetical protein AB7R40_22235 [Nitrospiraceae bacterium]
MAKYRKKPVVVEAFLWTGAAHAGEYPQWAWSALKKGTMYYQGGDSPHLTIETLEGKMRAERGDYIIRGIKGEIYPCKADIFTATYELVEESTQA